MLKNISKYLVIILTFFIMLFINKTDVYAAVNSSNTNTNNTSGSGCEWAVPSSYVDAKGNVIYDKNLWYKVSKSNGIKIYIDGIKFFDGSGEITTTTSQCPNYIMLTNGQGMAKGNMPAVEATKDVFQKYVVEQYETIPSKYLNEIGNGYKTISTSENSMGALMNNYIVLSNQKTTYSTANINMMKNAGFTESQLKSVFALDLADQGYDKNFYDISKVKWYNVISNDMKKIDKEKFYTEFRKNNTASSIVMDKNRNEDVILGMKMKVFQKWFTLNARYLFEEDLEKYKEAYTYAYLNTYPYEKIKNNLSAIDCAKEQASTQENKNCAGKISLTDVAFSGIDIIKNYEITCDDIPSIFHQLYIAIIIIAPILVIVLGSIDFARAVIASDEGKMKKFKSRFPIRLVALVLLILVPLIIKFVLGTVSGLSTTLLDCVVNGNTSNPEKKKTTVTIKNGTNSGNSWSQIGSSVDSLTNKITQKSNATEDSNNKWGQISKDLSKLGNDLQSKTVNADKAISDLETIKKKVENNSTGTTEDKKFTNQVKQDLNEILTKLKKQITVDNKK